MHLFGALLDCKNITKKKYHIHERERDHWEDVYSHLLSTFLYQHWPYTNERRPRTLHVRSQSASWVAELPMVT